MQSHRDWSLLTYTIHPGRSLGVRVIQYSGPGVPISDCEVLLPSDSIRCA